MFNTICRYCLLFFIYAFIGWCMEVMVTLYKDHKFVNRGFLIGPICPIYGYGCLLITILLYRYTDDIIVLFTMAIVICSILEYFTSYFMEKIFHARWWDYSTKKFNLNGRICMETMIPFGILGCVVMYAVNPLLNILLSQIPVTAINTITLIFIFIYIVDNVISFEVIKKMKNVAFSVNKDNTEEITRKVKAVLMSKDIFTKRLIKAFPNLEIFAKRTKEKIAQTKKEIKIREREIRKVQREIKKKQKALHKMKK